VYYIELLDSLAETQSADLGNFVEGMNVPRCARPPMFARKYLFRPMTRRRRGRGYTSNTTQSKQCTKKQHSKTKQKKLPPASNVSFRSRWLAIG